MRQRVPHPVERVPLIERDGGRAAEVLVFIHAREPTMSFSLRSDTLSLNRTRSPFTEAEVRVRCLVSLFLCALASVVQVSVANAQVGPSYDMAQSERIGTTRYVVRPGDTIYSIARAVGVPVAAILDLNPGLDPGYFEVGDALRVPGDSFQSRASDSHSPRPPGRRTCWWSFGGTAFFPTRASGCWSDARPTIFADTALSKQIAVAACWPLWSFRGGLARADGYTSPCRGSMAPTGPWRAVSGGRCASYRPADGNRHDCQRRCGVPDAAQR